MTEVFSVAYIHNFYGLASEEKFVRIEDYQKLKEQIEKMKCCKNCANSLYGERGENVRCEDCGDKGKLSEWELKE